MCTEHTHDDHGDHVHTDMSHDEDTHNAIAFWQIPGKGESTKLKTQC